MVNIMCQNIEGRSPDLSAGQPRIKYLTAQQCADIFAVHKRTWFRWVKERPEVPKPSIKKDNFSRWREDHVLAYAESLLSTSSQIDDADCAKKKTRPGGAEHVSKL